MTYGMMFKNHFWKQNVKKLLLIIHKEGLYNEKNLIQKQKRSTERVNGEFVVVFLLYFLV